MVPWGNSNKLVRRQEEEKRVYDVVGNTLPGEQLVFAAVGIASVLLVAGGKLVTFWPFFELGYSRCIAVVGVFAGVLRKSVCYNKSGEELGADDLLSPLAFIIHSSDG